MKDNRGMSLVELLVAMLVSTIVLSGVVYIIFYTARTYDKNSVGTNLQDEAQSALSVVSDHIMAANGICLRYDSGAEKTDSVLTGSLLSETDVTGTRYYYSGQALVYADESLYLVSFPNQYQKDKTDYKSIAKTENGMDYVLLLSDSVEGALDEIRDYVLLADGGKYRKECLLAEDMTKFYVTEGEESIWEAEQTFRYPFTLNIEMEFEKESVGETVSRKASNTAAVRNKLKTVTLNDKLYTRKLSDPQ